MLFKLQIVATKAEGRTKSATPGRGLTTPLTTCWSASVSEMAKESGRANLWVGETFSYIYISECHVGFMYRCSKQKTNSRFRLPRTANTDVHLFVPLTSRLLISCGVFLLVLFALSIRIHSDRKKNNLHIYNM